MLQTDTGIQINKYNKKLQQFSSNGIPMTAAATLNNLAFKARKESNIQFKRDHIIRSNWTERGSLFQKTRSTIPIRKMESRAGNIRPYADILEKGGIVKAESKFLSIPALGSRVSKSKYKRIAKKFKVNNLKQVRRLPKVGGSAKRKFAAMLDMARKDKFYGPFMISKEESGSGQLPRGIFNLTGPGRNRKGGGKITMLRKLKKAVKISGHSFVKIAGLRSANAMDKLYIKNAKRILRKYGRDIK